MSKWPPHSARRDETAPRHQGEAKNERGVPRSQWRGMVSCLPSVQALMGHKTIAMTMRYTHLAPGHKRTAIAVLDHMQEKVPAIFPTGREAAGKQLLQVLEMGG